MANTKNKTIIAILIAFFIILAGVLLYAFRDKIFKSKVVPTPESDTDKAGNKISWSGDNFPLKKGSSGQRVKYLQAALNMVKGENLATDGKFGEKTLASVQEHFKADYFSETAYNALINPIMGRINDYLQEAQTSGQSVKPATTFIGNSVFALKATQGFIAKKVDDSLTLDESQPVNYVENQYVGVVESENNGFLLCWRTNGSRVYILKNSVKIGY